EKRGRKDPELLSMEESTVATMVRLWKKRGGYFVTDPHPEDFKIVGKRPDGEGHDIKVLDWALMEKQDEFTLMKNFFGCMEPVGMNEYFSSKPFSRRAIVKGVFRALGKDGGKEFLQKAAGVDGGLDVEFRNYSQQGR
ncbi:hypothetical protein ACFLRC_04250, partial [Candidatus Altiarchaeota archaeon]